MRKWTKQNNRKNSHKKKKYYNNKIKLKMVEVEPRDIVLLSQKTYLVYMPFNHEAYTITKVERTRISILRGNSIRFCNFRRLKLEKERHYNWGQEKRTTGGGFWLPIYEQLSAVSQCDDASAHADILRNHLLGFQSLPHRVVDENVCLFKETLDSVLPRT